MTATRQRLEHAIRLGVDCVGGIPHYEPTAELGLREVHRVFELAKALRPQDRRPLRRDRRPAARRFLEVMADNTVKHGLAGRVTASHCTAMGSYEPYYSSKLRGFLRRSGINIVVNPYANSLIQGRLDAYPKRRGFAQLKELLADGVNVSLGNDVIIDPWYPMGKADLVDAAHLALHFTYMSGPRGDPRDAPVRDRAGRANARGRGRVRDRGGQARRLRRLRRRRARSRCIRLRATRRYVVRRGRVIAETSPAAHDPPRRARDLRARLAAGGFPRSGTASGSSPGTVAPGAQPRRRPQAGRLGPRRVRRRLPGSPVSGIDLPAHRSMTVGASQQREGVAVDVYQGAFGIGAGGAPALARRLRAARRARSAVLAARGSRGGGRLARQPGTRGARRAAAARRPGPPARARQRLGRRPLLVARPDGADIARRSSSG